MNNLISLVVNRYTSKDGSFTGKVSDTLKSISRSLAGITRTHMLLSMIFIKDGSIKFRPEHSMFQLVCMRLKRDQDNATSYEIFNADINYERGLKIKIDVGSRQSVRSDVKKMSAEEAQINRKQF